MINLKDFKKALGKTADEMSEDEILKLREHQDQEAEIYYAMWIEKINKNKNEV